MIATIFFVIVLAGLAVAAFLVLDEIRMMRRLLQESIAAAVGYVAQTTAAMPMVLRQLQEQQRAQMPPPRAILHRARGGAGLVETSGMLHCHGSAVIAAGQVGRVPVAPVRSNYCRPKAVSIIVHADGWPAIEQRVDVEQIFINQWPQMHMGTTSDQFAAPAGFGIPVSCATFSIVALIHVLAVEIRNNNKVAVDVHVYVWGDMVDELEAGEICGESIWARESRLAWQAKHEAEAELAAQEGTES